ncbi:hypothetical protein PIROE2DRAFT_7287 [Piromyces sp. E2]|nr:hypothetical protein PIROE2DRAFT_7287 [Piromyces sp. E2]|eukprot:OUM65699.1 hypothetical protein PIROE2DRAFT_7287 [Piromyces sp. E2]
MNNLSFSVLVVFFICISQIYAKGFHCQEYVTLKEGESCSKLTPITRMKDVIIINPLINCEEPMTEDTKVCTERNNKYSEEDYDFEEYVIKKNDNCSKIAKKLKITADVLERTNYPIFYCKNIKEYYKNEILYREDGDYEVIFDDESVDVTSVLEKKIKNKKQSNKKN